MPCRYRGLQLAVFCLCSLKVHLQHARILHAQESYPQDWPSFFPELIALAGEGAGAVDMFCRILLALDDDIISLDVPRCVYACACSL